MRRIKLSILRDSESVMVITYSRTILSEVCCFPDLFLVQEFCMRVEITFTRLKWHSLTFPNIWTTEAWEDFSGFFAGNVMLITLRGRRKKVGHEGEGELPEHWDSNSKHYVGGERNTRVWVVAFDQEDLFTLCQRIWGWETIT